MTSKTAAVFQSKEIFRPAIATQLAHGDHHLVFAMTHVTSPSLEAHP